MNAVAAGVHHSGLPESSGRSIDDLLDLLREGNAAEHGANGDSESLREDVMETVSPALMRLVRQAERTISHCNSALDKQKVGELLLSGRIVSWQRMVDFLEGHLGITVHLATPFAPRHVSSSLALPERPEKSAAFIQAVGAALADESTTLNLIDTQADKVRAGRRQRVNRAIFAGFLLATACCCAIYTRQACKLRHQEETVADLRMQLAACNPRLNTPFLETLSAQAMASQLSLRRAGLRHLGTAVAAAVINRTGEPITLTDLKLDLGSACPSASEAPYTRSAEVAGIITGDRPMLQPLLASYVLRLNRSPLFSKVDLRKSEITSRDGADTLRFALGISVVPGIPPKKN